MQTIISRYAHLPGNKDFVFRTLCSLLVENSDGVSWSEFGDQEWELFRQMAIGENVAEMAYYIIKSKPSLFHLNDVERNTLKAIEKAEAITTLRNAVLFKEVDKIINTLVQNNVPVISLKGVDLAVSVYPDPGLRSMSDIDILVHEKDFQIALALMNNIGYHDYSLESQDKLQQLLSHHAHLRKDIPTHPILELHWTLIASAAYKYSISVDWFWHNTEGYFFRKREKASREYPTKLSIKSYCKSTYPSAHQILQHGGRVKNLRWLLDLKLLIERYQNEIDWNELSKQALLFDWGHALEIALISVQNCFQVSVPEGFLFSLQKRSGKNDKIINQKEKWSSSVMVEEFKLLYSLNWTVRVKHFLAHFFPDPTYIRKNYNPKPKWLWPFYYFYRWFEITHNSLTQPEGWMIIIISIPLII